MAITDKTQGVWNTDEVYNKINQSDWPLPGSVSDPVEIWSWGYNNGGVLTQPQGSAGARSSPIQIPGDWALFANGNNGQGGTTGNFQIHTRPNGTLYFWGSGYRGSSASNAPQASARRSSPTQIGTDSNWAAGSSGSHVMWTKSNGTLWGWGSVHAGQLGLNQNFGTGPYSYGYSSPVQVGTATNWSTSHSTGAKISVAAMGVPMASGVINTDGELWMMGANTTGALAQNDATPGYSSPVQIPGTTWASISFGYGSAMARKTDGTAWTWGSNSNGQLGHNQGPTGNYSSPVQLPGTWASISAARVQGSGIKTDGTLWTWGSNDQGQLGLNEAHPGSYNKSSPTQVGTDNTWSTAAFGAGNIGSYGNAVFLKSNGTLWSWGQNPYGASGQNTSIQTSSPTQVGTATNWQEVGRTGEHAEVTRSVS